MAIPGALWQIFTSEDDARDKTLQIQILRRKNKTIDKLLNNDKFWETKLREDYGLTSKELDPKVSAVNHYIDLSYKPEKYELGFMQELEFPPEVVSDEKNLDLRRATAVVSCLRILAELRKAGVNTESLGHTKFFIGKTTFCHFTPGSETQTLPVGKINKACFSNKGVAVPELLSDADKSSRLVVDNTGSADLVLPSQKLLEQVPFVVCGAYVVARVNGTYSIYERKKLEFRNADTMSIYDFP